MLTRRTLMSLVAILVITATVLSGCGATATPTAAPTAVPTKPAATAAPTQAPAPTQGSPTKAPPTVTPVPPTPTPQGPTIGGTLIRARDQEPDTLDAHKTSRIASSEILPFLGGALVAREPKEGKYVPYLAESWTISADGLVWEFKLRKDVKFHDGTLLKASDFAWTFLRAIDPATKSAGAGGQLGSIKAAEAVDDYTLRLTLKAPNFPFLLNLTNAGWLQPLPQAAVTKMGDAFGRSPIGVGPYKFKEWKTGEKVVLERNPDYKWGPAYVHAGPAYIETIEFRVLPEYATSVAGLETGAVMYAENILPNDVARLKPTGKVQFFEASLQGSGFFLAMNVTKTPFDDVRVRKAFNLAMDRAALIKTAAQGAGIPLYGPITPATAGYWPGIEKIGYGFDLPQAKALMKEAGYTAGADGILAKDGKPLKLVLKVSSIEIRTKAAEVIKEQLKALGVDVEIQQFEHSVIIATVWKGDYVLAFMLMEYSEADLMRLLFLSTQVGSLNMSMIKNPDLDAILNSTLVTMDPDKRQAFVNQAQQWLVENAVVAPLFSSTRYIGVTSNVKGLTFSAVTQAFNWHDAYISAK